MRHSRFDAPLNWKEGNSCLQCCSAIHLEKISSECSADKQFLAKRYTIPSFESCHSNLFCSCESQTLPSDIRFQQPMNTDVVIVATGVEQRINDVLHQTQKENISKVL
jgi:hypothetical protein